MLLEADDSQLLLIDYQTRLMPAIFEGDVVLANAVRLAKIARLLAVPAWGTLQNPQGLGPMADALAAELALRQPECGELVEKMAFAEAGEGSALVELLRPPAPPAPSRSKGFQPPSGNIRSLPRHLQQKAAAARQAESTEPQQVRNTVVLAGCETHICLLQTALELLEQEFEVWVVTDACGSRSAHNRDAAFDRLAGNGAELLTTEMVAYEWIRTAAHPLFREVLAVVK